MKILQTHTRSTYFINYKHSNRSYDSTNFIEFYQRYNAAIV